MKIKNIPRIAFLAILLMVMDAFAGPVTIVVTPSSAPNAFGSSYWNDYVDNSITAQYLGVSSYGNAGLPSYYSVAPSNMNVEDNVVTGFPSWKGSADPGTDYGPAFANEYGNRLHFGVMVKGNGTKISIDGLNFTAISTDPFNTLSFSFATGSYNYSASYRGLLYGTDNIRGTSDDIWITGGPASQLVDEIIGRGSGNAWDTYLSDPGANNQDRIDNISTKFALGTAPFDFGGIYNYSSNPNNPSESEIATGIAIVHFNSVSDSTSSAGVLAIGLIGVLGLRRRFV